MSMLFGGGKKAEQAAQSQAQAAEQSRQDQTIANNRQLAELRRNDAESPLSRRRPRGRRLFADAGDANLKSTLG